MKYQLDTSRLLCPMPVIRTQDKIKELQPGDELAVTCTDPGALLDIPAWCRINGHEVIDSTKPDKYGELVIMVRVGSEA